VEEASVQSTQKTKRFAYLVAALYLCVACGALQAQVNVRLPALTTKTGSDVKIPVTVPDLNKENITSFEFVVLCDTTIIRFTGTEQEGTLSAGLMMFANTKVAPYGPGKMKVVCASATPLTGQGVLVYLKAKVQSKKGSSPLQLMSFNFNAGKPAAKTSNGTVKVESGLKSPSRNVKPSGSNDTLTPLK